MASSQSQSITCGQAFKATCQGITDYFQIAEWFPTDRDRAIKSLALGILAGFTLFIVSTTVFFLLEKYCPNFTISQDAVKIFSIFKNVHPLADIAWRAFWRVYVVFLGPVVEEVIFRGILDHGIKKCQGQETSTLSKISRLLLTTLIFAACHLSPFQNALTNGAVFGTTFLLGLGFAVMREKRKDLYSSIGTHMVYNMLVAAAI